MMACLFSSYAPEPDSIGTNFSRGTYTCCLGIFGPWVCLRVGVRRSATQVRSHEFVVDASVRSVSSRACDLGIVQGTLVGLVWPRVLRLRIVQGTSVRSARFCACDLGST